VVKALGADLLFMMGVVEPTNWDIDKTKFPTGVNKTTAYIREQGLLVGLHTLPYAPTSCQGDCARAAFFQENGLGPTYRSGNENAHLPTEDLGFWWAHDNEGNEAQNGNPIPTWYGFECPQRVPGYHCGRWGSNMTLNHTYWSPLGDFRQVGWVGLRGGWGSMKMTLPVFSQQQQPPVSAQIPPTHAHTHTHTHTHTHLLLFTS
jgi:hypothetical protein